MLKKIIVVLALNMIAMHNNFAMETRKVPRSLTKFKGIAREFGNRNKQQIQAFNNQLQQLQANKNDLIDDISHSKKNIQKNMDNIAENYDVQKGLAVVTTALTFTTGGLVAWVPVLFMAGVREDSIKSANCINDEVLKIHESNNLLDKFNQDEINIKCSLSQLNYKDVLNKDINDARHIQLTLEGEDTYFKKKLLLEAEEYNNTECPIIKHVKKSIEALSICLAQNPTIQSLRKSIEPSLNKQVKSLTNMALYVFKLKHIYRIKNTIEFFMQLRATCNKFHELLTYEAIADLIKEYKQKEKDVALNFILSKKIITNDNEFRCMPELILLYAGANPIKLEKSIADDTLKSAYIKETISTATCNLF